MLGFLITLWTVEFSSGWHSILDCYCVPISNGLNLNIKLLKRKACEIVKKKSLQGM